jgi:hypothetical protein
MLICGLAGGSMGGAVVAIGIVAVLIIVIAIIAFINNIKGQR